MCSEGYSSDVFNALKDHEPGPLIVQQCRFLEQIYGTNLTSSLLTNSSDISVRSIKKTLRKADQNYIWDQAANHEPGPLIVQQCRFLEQIYGTNLTSSLLTNSSDISVRSIKKTLRKADQNYIWDQAANHNSLSLMSRDVSWPRLWDTARDHGPQPALLLQAVLRMLTSPTYKESSCSHCNMLMTWLTSTRFCPFRARWRQ